jgi:ethanolamine ammonia-lyase small subunit
MTALEQHMREQNDIQHARRSAEQIAYALKEFIPDHCFRDAIDKLTETMHKAGVELTNASQRKQYEQMQRLTINPGKITDWNI